jgi:hypothetical protein
MKYLKVFTDFAEKMELYGDAERGRLFTAMLKYAETGIEPELKGNERFLWATARADIDRQAASYKNKVGGAEKARALIGSDIRDNQVQSDAIRLKSEQDKDKDKDKDKDISPNGDKGKRAARFVPPTVDEVAAYCQERGNDVDPERFVDFYACKGWCVGKNPMKDWRAAVRTWEKRGNYSGGYTQSAPVATADRLAEMIRRGDFDD